MPTLDSAPLLRSWYRFSWALSSALVLLYRPPRVAVPCTRIGSSSLCASAGPATNKLAMRVERSFLLMMVSPALSSEELTAVARGVAAVDRVVAVEAGARHEAIVHVRVGLAGPIRSADRDPARHGVVARCA